MRLMGELILVANVNHPDSSYTDYNLTVSSDNDGSLPKDHPLISAGSYYQAVEVASARFAGKDVVVIFPTVSDQRSTDQRRFSVPAYSTFDGPIIQDTNDPSVIFMAPTLEQALNKAQSHSPGQQVVLFLSATR